MTPTTDSRRVLMKASKSIHRAGAQRPAFLGSVDLVVAAGGAGDHDESVPHEEEETTTTTTTRKERPVVQPEPRPQQPQPQTQQPQQPQQPQYVSRPRWRASAYYYYMPGCF
jgi:hypothetical protein